MATTSTVTSTPAATGPPPFARLIRELAELGFEETIFDAGTTDTVYTATDSAVAVTLDVVADPPRACIERTDGRVRSGISIDATVADATQLIVLYAAINDDPTQALEGAATALGVEPPAPATDAVPGGG